MVIILVVVMLVVVMMKYDGFPLFTFVRAREPQMCRHDLLLHSNSFLLHRCGRGNSSKFQRDREDDFGDDNNVGYWGIVMAAFDILLQDDDEVSLVFP